MASTITQFLSMLSTMGSDVIFHREDGGTPCPCRTPEGFRDPAWHNMNPTEPLCNEQGFLTTAVEFSVKASIQPAQTQYVRIAQRVNALLGDVQRDDKFGVLPCTWGGHAVDLDDWSDAGEDYLVYDGRRYVVVAADKLPDIDGTPGHHWECGLRLLSGARPAAPVPVGLYPNPGLYPNIGLYPEAA